MSPPVARAVKSESCAHSSVILHIKQTEGVQKPDFMSMAIRQGLCRPLIAGLADAEGYALDPDDLLAHVIEVATERSICATPRMFPQWLSIC